MLMWGQTLLSRVGQRLFQAIHMFWCFHPFSTSLRKALSNRGDIKYEKIQTIKTKSRQFHTFLF